MYDVKIEVTNNVPQVKSAFKSQMKAALQAIGQQCEGYAKDDCPVDTGRLRNSITNKEFVDEQSVYIGTDVEYAIYVELRDNVSHATGKAHFLRDAAARHSAEYKKMAESILKS